MEASIALASVVAGAGYHPAMRLKVPRWQRDIPRVGVAHPDQAAFCSTLVIEGQRPRWLYRSDPINESDSGWRLIESGESDEWLNERGH